MKNIFGYGKDAEFVSFPYDWIKPGEFRYDSTGERLIKGTKEDMLKLATYRRDVLKLSPVFWMKPE